MKNQNLQEIIEKAKANAIFNSLPKHQRTQFKMMVRYVYKVSGVKYNEAEIELGRNRRYLPSHDYINTINGEKLTSHDQAYQKMVNYIENQTKMRRIYIGHIYKNGGAGRGNDEEILRQTPLYRKVFFNINFKKHDTGAVTFYRLVPVND